MLTFQESENEENREKKIDKEKINSKMINKSKHIDNILNVYGLSTIIDHKLSDKIFKKQDPVMYTL